MIITATNPETSALERTFLNQSYPLGVTSVEVKNNQRISNNDRILIGEMGLSQSEIVTAGTPNANGTTLPVGATLFAHPADTPIYQLQFDQVKIYKSTTGETGTYTLLTTVNLDVTAADKETTYDDTTAVDGDYYKISMYNSVSTVESALSDPIPATAGWNTNQVGYTIEQFYLEIGDYTESQVSRQELFGWFNEVNDDLTIGVARPYRFLYTRNVYDRVAAQNYFTLPTNSDGTQVIWKFDRLDYRFYDTSTNPTTDTTMTVPIFDLAYFRNRFNDNTIDGTTEDDSIQAAAINDATNAIDYYPPSQTTSTYGCFYLYYWKYFTRLSSEGDIFETYSPRIYKLYALEKYYRKRSITDPSYLNQAQAYMNDYNLEKANYKKHDRHDRGTPRKFRPENRTFLSYRD